MRSLRLMLLSSVMLAILLLYAIYLIFPRGIAAESQSPTQPFRRNG